MRFLPKLIFMITLTSPTPGPKCVFHGSVRFPQSCLRLKNCFYLKNGTQHSTASSH